MTEFRVKPGGKVTIGIRGGVESQSEETGQRFIGVEVEDSNYVFRGKTAFSFFDLGSRLRSVPADAGFSAYRLREYLSQEPTAANNGDNFYNEYVEVRFEAPGTYNNDDGNPQIELSTAEWAQLDKVLLGSFASLDPAEGPPDPVNPFSTSGANGSGRSLGHSLEFPVDMIGQILPTFSLVADDEMQPYEFTFPGDAQPTLGYREPLSDVEVPADLIGGVFKQREEQPSDANERWNSHNLESGAAQRQVVIRSTHYKEDKGKHLLIANLDNFNGVPGLPPSEVVRVPRYVGTAGSGTLAWHGFFTKDTDNFKITKTPSFSASVANYRFKDQDAVYLRPAVVPVRLGVFSPAFTTHSAWMARWASVYPGRSLLSSGDAVSDEIVATRSLFADAEHAPSGALLQVIGSAYWLRVGSLVAVIRQGDSLFYIWSKVDVRRFGGIFS